mgnify:CR=1 FL=1
MVKTFGSVSTKHIVEQLREKYDIRVDKRKFINAHPIGALGYSNLKVELYKGVIATIRVHLSEKIGGRFMPRVFPHDLEAERSLLGSMLISKEACQDILNKCEIEIFMKNHIKYYSMQ